jgi:hypothetical protein
MSMSQVQTRSYTLRLLTSAVAILAPACGGDYEESPPLDRQLDLAVERAVPIVPNLKKSFPAARLQMKNGRVNRIFGSILATGDTPEEAAESFKDSVIAAHEAGRGDVRALDAGPDRLAFTAKARPIGLMFDTETNDYKFLLYRYGQQVAGMPVYDAQLSVLVKNEPGHPVVWANSSLRDVAKFTPPRGPRVLSINRGKSLDSARALADVESKGGRAPESLDRFDEPRLVVFAGAEDEDAAPRLAMLYEAEEDRSLGRWKIIADASSGDVLHIEDLAVSADVSGTVRGNATNSHAAAACAPEVSLPMPYAEVNITGGSAGFTSDIGFFYLLNPGTTPVTVNSTLQGNFFNVLNAQGPNVSLSTTVTPPNQAHFLHNAANNNELIVAQSNAYYHINQTRDFLLDYAPGYPVISSQTDFLAEVNGNTGLCPGNAWYLGSQVLFCATGFGVTNTAFGTVVHHEFGHHIVSSGGSGQGEYGEGMADTVAALLTNEPRFAVGWTVGDCANGLRTADNTCQYDPVNCSSCGSEVHACGQLISGIVWDLRQELMVTEPAGWRDIVNSLTLSSVPLHSGSAIDANIAIDFLTLDDNDGNLANGTPHGEEICAAFDAHGIDCPLTPTGTPCTGICSNPVVFSWTGSYQSGPLGTGAVCRETTHALAGGNCGNFTGGRTLSVNGTVMPCNNQNWPTLPAARNGGYCVTTTTGNFPWAFFTMW